MEQMIKNDVGIDMTFYNTFINFYCKEGKLEAAYKLLDEIESRGLECDDCTHSIITNGLCRVCNIEGAMRHLNCVYTTGFASNVALNCLIDRLCKAGQINRAIRLFESMEARDSFT
ncbi:hypothetical protein IC582_011319 [Cucumis melo]|uniref:Pentatricopeptide repeat-containing protein n=1 Tax=Cucumis melo TaxID=3656 RepID=A0A9I9CIF3_CUCME